MVRTRGRALRAATRAAGRGLAAKDSHLFSADSSDPYVIVAFAGETIGKTEVVAETTEPTWECDKPGKPERPTRITTLTGAPPTAGTRSRKSSIRSL